MMSLSAAILVATCTATFGLHSSSSTTSSYSYFAFGSAFRSLTARSAELRPPRPFTETPPVRGPMKPTFTLSFALATPALAVNATAATSAIMLDLCCIRTSRLFYRWRDLRRGRAVKETVRLGRHAAVPRELHRQVKQRFVTACPADEREANRAAGDRAGRNADLRQAGQARNAGQPHHTDAERLHFRF